MLDDMAKLCYYRGYKFKFANPVLHNDNRCVDVSITLSNTDGEEWGDLKFTIIMAHCKDEVVISDSTFHSTDGGISFKCMGHLESLIDELMKMAAK